MAIKSRKHVQSRFNQHVGAALAVMLLPVAAQAADPAGQSAPASQQMLNEVTVVGTKENDFKADKASSPKYTEALVNTPQTIVVIKKELIEQQGALTLTDALRNTPGVGTFFLGENGNTNTGDAVYMRGFDASSSIYVDGVRDIGSISRDVFNIEQIDVLKGPAGTDSGRGSPTGSINLVSKTPNLENSINSLITVGSGKQKRATADWNRVIDADSGTAFRLNLLKQDSGNAARDEVKNERWAIAPSVTFGLGKPTRVTASFLHVDQDNVPDGGVPTIGLPGYVGPDNPANATGPNPVPVRTYINSAPKVDPKNFYGLSSDYDKVKADMFTLKVDHDFSPAVKLQNVTRWGKTKQDYLLSAFMGSSANLVTNNPTLGAVPGNPSTWLLARSLRTIKDQKNAILTNQSSVTASFDTGAVKHTLVGGLEFTSEKQTNYSYVASSLGTSTAATTRTIPLANLYNPNPNESTAAFRPVRSGATTDGQIDTQSAYVFDTLKLNDQWQVSGGVRADHFKTKYDAIALQGAAATGQPQLIPVGTPIGTSLSLSDTVYNGKISALYKPTPDSSVYALYSTSKAPPGTNFTLSTSANSAQNLSYDPQETTTKEIGTKWDFLKQKLSFTAALYQTEVKNEVEQDPVDLVYYQNGKKRVQGAEIGVVGEVMHNWLVSAGYTRMNTSVESGRVVTASGINNLSYTPKQAFTSWTSYTFPFGLKIGGGGRYVGEMLRGTDGAYGTPAKIDSYWVFDAMATYTVNKNLDLQLNAYNLADKTYAAAINKSGYRYTPGQPRSFSLTANMKF